MNVTNGLIWRAIGLDYLYQGNKTVHWDNKKFFTQGNDRYVTNLITKETNQLDWNPLDHIATEDDLYDEEGERYDSPQIDSPAIQSDSVVFYDLNNGKEIASVSFSYLIFQDDKGELSFHIYGFQSEPEGAGWGSKALIYLDEALYAFGWRCPVVVPYEERDPTAKGFWDKMDQMGITTD